jgi:phosphatidylinositol glycan class C protein
MSCWLLIMNIFSFDYGSGEGAGATKFPASLSTNAAVMASTVLASRLPSTTHVFSLMLFSIEVFGLFPIFRRQLRHTSWTGHVLLTLAGHCGRRCGRNDPARRMDCRGGRVVLRKYYDGFCHGGM